MSRIGIGAREDILKVVESVRASGLAEKIVVYCEDGPGISRFPDISFHVSPTPVQDLVRDLRNKYLAAAIRGTLPANETLSCLKTEFGVDHLERIALLETAGGRKFLFAPVGIDEGWTVTEKIALVRKGKEIARIFGLSETVSVLSGGRLGDLGRNRKVDRSMADAELVAHMTGAIHREILIEDAIADSGVIIAPDRISGNLIFRTLAFLGAGHGHGAPVVNISGIFVDTSRASADYSNAIMLADSLSKQ